MARLKKSQLKRIDEVLVKKDLIKMISDHLTANNIDDVEIDFIKFKPKVDPQKHILGINLCGPGQIPVLSCSLSGKCEYVCMNI